MFRNLTLSTRRFVEGFNQSRGLQLSRSSISFSVPPLVAFPPRSERRVWSERSKVNSTSRVPLGR